MEILIGDVNELGIKSQKVCEFYSNNWNRKIALSNYRFYKWQFTESPSDGGKDHCMVAFDAASKKVIGVMGLNRRPFILNDQVIDGAELTTWIVDENHIGKGIGAKILRNIQSKYEVSIGMGISDMALPIYMRSGFRFIKNIPRFIKVFDFDTISKHARYNSLASKLIKYWVNSGNDVSFEIVKVSDGNLKKIGAVTRKQYNCFCRNYSYLNWRYSNHPVFEYKQFVIQHKSKDKGEGVFVCFREENSVDNLKILHVMDCFGDQQDMPAAISYIHHYCKDNDFQLADFYCTSTRISKYFVTGGWFSTNDDSCFQFPHLFHPVELRIPPTTSVVYWSKTNFIELADTSNLYITKQDADLDRPTMATYV